MLVFMGSRDCNWSQCSPESPVRPIIYPQPLSLFIFVSVYKWIYGGSGENLHSFMSEQTVRMNIKGDDGASRC